jgi:RNA polymerase sigma factor (sigma-70 family)
VKFLPEEMAGSREALDVLAALNPRKAKVIELCYFAGLDVDETAEVLKVCRGTVLRDWQLARAWLRHELSHSPVREWGL